VAGPGQPVISRSPCKNGRRRFLQRRPASGSRLGKYANLVAAMAQLIGQLSGR